MLVSGTGSIWSNANYLYMGYASPGNQLVVSNGARVFNYIGDVGLYAGSSNNTIVITGSGSSWNNSYIYLGVSDCANQLVIANGGQVTDIFSILGDNPESSNNSALVTGAGSVWNNSAQFYVGWSGSSNQLAITQGGSVVDFAGVVGDNSNSLNNLAVVDGSVWNNSDSLYVGDGGAGNQLIITNGGVVLSPTSYLGAIAGSSNNLAVVTSSGSVWSNQTLYVGLNGTGNQLTIGGGGTVVSPTTIVSGGNTSSTNLIQLSGGALIVSGSGASGRLVVGQAGPGQLILNAGTVTADSLRLTNGVKSLLSFNGGWLTSGGTFVTNTQPFVVGDGMSTATFQLAGGIHSFQNGLRIRNAALLTGCGTINGVVVVDAGGTGVASCSPLVFTQSLTNNGTLRASNSHTLEVYGTLVNNGTIDLINGGLTNFHGPFINNGTVLNASSVVIGSTTVTNLDVIVQIQSVPGHNYQLQITPALAPLGWANFGAPQMGTGAILTFTDPSGATNQPSRFYRVLVTAE